VSLICNVWFGVNNDLVFVFRNFVVLLVRIHDLNSHID